MSIEWDSEFQRLSSGEVPHPETAELLGWQVNALVENEPQQVETWFMYDVATGSVHFNRRFGVDDPTKITHTIEVFMATNETQEAVSIIELEYTPQSTIIYRYNTKAPDPIGATLGIIKDIKAVTNLNRQESGMLDNLGILAEAIVLNKDDDLPDGLIVDLGRSMTETISRRADTHIISNEFSASNEDEELCAKLRRYVDLSFERPELSDGEGEFELLITNKESNIAKTLFGGVDGVYVMDLFDTETGIGEYRPATATDEHDMAIMLAALIRPSLPIRSPEWLSQYSGYLGWSIHREGPETPYGITISEELNHVRMLFVKQLEAIYHLIPNYAQEREIPDVELLLADLSCHPNGFAVVADELVNFDNLSVLALDSTESLTAIYRGIRFLKPGSEDIGFNISYGAYIDVVVAIANKVPGKISKGMGSVALNASELLGSDRTFN